MPLLNFILISHTTGTPAALDAAAGLRGLSAAAARAAVTAAEAGEASLIRSHQCITKVMHSVHDPIHGIGLEWQGAVLIPV